MAGKAINERKSNAAVRFKTPESNERHMERCFAAREKRSQARPERKQSKISAQFGMETLSRPEKRNENKIKDNKNTVKNNSDCIAAKKQHNLQSNRPSGPKSRPRAQMGCFPGRGLFCLHSIIQNNDLVYLIMKNSGPFFPALQPGFQGLLKTFACGMVLFFYLRWSFPADGVNGMHGGGFTGGQNPK